MSQIHVAGRDGNFVAIPSGNFKVLLLDVDPFHVQKDKLLSAPRHEPITLANLADVNESPYDFQQNLVLNTTVDGAETELSVLRCWKGESPKCLVFMNPSDENTIHELRARFDTSIAFGCIGHSPSAAILGPYVCNRLHLPEILQTISLEIKRTEENGRLNGPIPILLELPETVENCRDVIERMCGDPVMNRKVFVNGASYNSAILNDVLRLTDWIAILNPPPPVDLRMFSDSTIEDIYQLARNVAHHMRNGQSERFVLGGKLVFATQLRRYGGRFIILDSNSLDINISNLGHGYNWYIAFLNLLERLGCKSDQLDMIALGNALGSVSRIPKPPQRIQASDIKWRCGYCDKLQSELIEPFESHGVKFCSARCMRNFRTKEVQQVPDPNNSRRPISRTNHDGGWSFAV